MGESIKRHPNSSAEPFGKPYWRGKKIFWRTFETKYHHFSINQMKIIPTKLNDELGNATNFKLASTLPKTCSPDLHGVLPSNKSVKRATIAIRQMALEDYPELFRHTGRENSAYEKLYKKLVIKWAERMMEGMHKLKVTEAGRVKGFLYLLCNRILAILARNPLGYDID